jgi:serine/threonine protein phosphatase 1
MRTLAIGDIHGCLRALDLLLEIVQPQPDDVVVTLGDYVDRGPDSSGVLDRLIDLQSRCKYIALKGNHDIMMLKARDDPEEFKHWLSYGGRETLQSYGADPSWGGFAKSIPQPHWRFIAETCVAYHEIDAHFFVHANVYADAPLAEQPDYMLFWEKLEAFDHRPHESGKTMICGHSVQRSGLPLVIKRAVCIDTWVYGDGWLTCLDVGSNKYWQANQRGQTRTDTLEDAD